MLIVSLSCFVIVTAVSYWLRYLNLRYLKNHGSIVPPEFEGSIDPEHLKKISDYTYENNRAGIIESIVSNFILLLFLFGGLLGVYDRWIISLTGSFIWGGVLYFLLLMFAQTVIDVPFSLYRHFRIENRYEFNTMTGKLWFFDLVKSIMIASVLGTIVIAASLVIIQSNTVWWWLWVWVFLLVFGIFVMYISPYIIEPLFFKFEPLKVEGLEERIRALLEKAGLVVSRVFQVDASRRSRHSNAYFTGIGRVKRIVLFDTLIEQMNQEEVLAVLAHEVGHWKKRHVLKRLILTESMAFTGLFAAYHLLSWSRLPEVIGLADASFYGRVVILGFIASIASFPFTPFFSFLSRRDERAADRFASELTGSPESMASALVKLSRENLSNLHPHPLYVKFYYSHPPVVERIRTLRKSDNQQLDR